MNARYTIERENLLQVIADRLDKEISKLEPWVDYHPVMIDDRIRAITQPIAPRWTVAQ